MTHQVGDLARLNATFRNVAGDLADPTTVTFTVRNPAGTETSYVYGVDVAIVRSSLGVYYVDVDLLTAGRWAYRWDATGTVQGSEPGQLVVTSSDLEDVPPTTFATVDDLAARLGQTFTDAQTVQARAMLEAATSLILDALGKTETWLAAQTSIPGRLRVTCIEVAVRGFVNPTGVRTQQESVGSYSHSETWTAGTGGLDLTGREERACRRAVYGSGVAAPRLGAILDEVIVRGTYDTALELDGIWLDSGS